MGSSTRFCRHSLTSDTGREVWIYHANVKGDESYEYMIHHDTLQLTFPSSWSCVYSRTEIYRNQVSVQKCSKYQKCFDNLIDIEVSSRKYLEVSSHHRPIILYRSPTHFQPDIHLLKMERPVDFPGLNPSHPIRTIRNVFFLAGHLFGAKATNIAGDHESATFVAATTLFAFGQLCHICQLHVGLTAITFFS